MPDYFSTGLKNLARHIQRAPQTTQPWSFPDNWSPHRVERQGDGETIAEYFLRLVDDELDGKVDFAIEEEALVLVSLHCESSILRRLNIETFISPEVPLSDLYLELSESDDVRPIHYLRLDYEPGQPGPFFKEPQPHLHVRPKGDPRLSLEIPEGATMLGAFFDFLYRTCFYDEWLGWAREIWDREARMRAFEPEYFNTIVQAFEQGNLEALQDPQAYEHQFLAMKNAIREARNQLFPEIRRDSDDSSCVNLA